MRRVVERIAGSEQRLGRSNSRMDTRANQDLGWRMTAAEHGRSHWIAVRGRDSGGFAVLIVRVGIVGVVAAAVTERVVLSFHLDLDLSKIRFQLRFDWRAP